MQVRAQIAMVMNLDKCIGCHTCSVTCKNVWTNRRGTEYMWFNDVETKPGVGYPKRWEDQEQWKGGWELKGGKLRLKAGELHPHLVVNGWCGVSGVSGVNGVAGAVSTFTRGG